MMPEKRCANPECNKLLPLTEFRADTRSKDGRSKICKECMQKQDLSKVYTGRITNNGMRKCLNTKCGKYIPVQLHATSVKCPKCGAFYPVGRNGKLKKPDLTDQIRITEVINFIQTHPQTHASIISKQLHYRACTIRNDLYKLKEAGKIKVTMRGCYKLLEWVAVEHGVAA
jgi:predicted RNA-binding Zn-ribbon protein involved in translation (DUF1610 family)